jgi:hypothetical protein
MEHLKSFKLTKHSLSQKLNEKLFLAAILLALLINLSGRYILKFCGEDIMEQYAVITYL